MPSNNPRYARPKARNDLRKRLAREGLPCALCGKPIDYSLTTYVDPKDGKTKRHPLSFEVDEIIPISKGGSPTDRDNVQPVHRICNQRKGNKIMREDDGRIKSQTEMLPWSRKW